MSDNINHRIIVSFPRNLAKQHVHSFFAVGLSNNTVRAISDPLAENLVRGCLYEAYIRASPSSRACFHRVFT